MGVDHKAGLDPETLDAIVKGRHLDPFAVLGPHSHEKGTIIRAFLPFAQSVMLADAEDRLIGPFAHIEAGLWAITAAQAPPRYRLHIEWPTGPFRTEDPYAFPLLLGDVDIYLLAEGRHRRLADALGAQAMTVEGVPGVRFAVWAPNAQRVSVVGDFNAWDGRRHPMRLRREAGVFELFIPRLEPGERYKYEIIGPDGSLLPQKADPVARAFEKPPATASIVAEPTPFPWTDEPWLTARRETDAQHGPISIYEVHPGSWRRPREGDVSWDYLSETLIPYIVHMGFTHIELLPVMEHPFGGSWGYQPLGLFAPTARYGTPADFARFVDRCHAAGIGVLLDWVPAHFPADPQGLARFDGTALYEHQDPREGYHQDWNTLIYNFGRTEVQGFLTASALEWLHHFHIDGLRVDAVASMLYRDYSRKEGEWIPNRYGGRENLEAVHFLKHLNGVVRHEAPGALMIAEESTAWPGVTAPLEHGGLGFHFKWNMGWMHDSLLYIGRDPVHRRHHHGDLAFSFFYAFSERFILPLSHDEVVHGKRSLFGRMPGDSWQKFASLRSYFGFMWAYPGKKLLFMGGELADPHEWNHDGALDFSLLERPENAGIQRLVRDLNTLYRAEAALHTRDGDAFGFQWVIGDDAENSVFAFLRWGHGENEVMLAITNFTPVPRENYRVGVPRSGVWIEAINTDAALYGGSNMGNAGRVEATAMPAHGYASSLCMTLPPLATVLFKFAG